jgi:hypothetical protein
MALNIDVEGVHRLLGLPIVKVVMQSNSVDDREARSLTNSESDEPDTVRVEN